MSPLLFGMKKKKYYLSLPTTINFGGKKCVLCGGNPRLVIFEGVKIKSYFNSIYIQVKKPNLVTSITMNSNATFLKPKEEYIEIKNGYTEKKLEQLSKRKLSRHEYFDIIFKQQNTGNLNQQIEESSNYPFSAGT